MPLKVESVNQHAEVESIVGVLPDVFAADHDALAEGLEQAGVGFVAEAGLVTFWAALSNIELGQPWPGAPV